MIPGHVLTAFGADGDATTRRPRPAGRVWDNGFHFGGVVYAQATDTTGWSSKIRAKLSVPGLRVARPVLSTDGRFVVGGWKATLALTGRPELRVDEAVAAALRLAEALADEPGPVGLERSDVYANAERDAWAWCDERFGEVTDPLGAGHADMLATTLFDGQAAPAITDIVPFVAPRPIATTAAMVVADALIFAAESGVDLGILSRFAFVPDLEEIVVRCVRQRYLIAQRHPGSNSLTRSNIDRVWTALMSRRPDTI